MNNTKQHFYKTLNAIVGTNRIDNEEAYIINDYISRLEVTIKDEQELISKQKEVLDKIKDKCLENMYIDDRGEEVENIERDIKPSEILELLEEIE